MENFSEDLPLAFATRVGFETVTDFLWLVEYNVLIKTNAWGR